jgi:TonB family protein
MWKALLLAALICNPANDKECRIEEEMGFVPVAPSLDSQWIAVWKAAIVTKLDEKKHYPEAAVANREHGVARVFFAIDREGRLLESRIVQSSGSANLDAAALDTLKRAEPFPPPPDSLKGERIDLTIPFRFDQPRATD